MSDEPPEHRAGPIEWLTVPGRLLLIGTVVGCAAVLYWYVAITLPNLPSARYPLVIWVVPVLLCAFFFFLIAAFVLERLGVQIYRRDR